MSDDGKTYGEWALSDELGRAAANKRRLAELATKSGEDGSTLLAEADLLERAAEGFDDGHGPGARRYDMTDQPRTTFERACRALCVADGLDPDEDWRMSGDVMLTVLVKPENRPRWTRYGDKVRAVLLAIREPEETLHPEPFDERYFDMCRRDDIKGIWQAMIDHILGEGK